MGMYLFAQLTFFYMNMWQARYENKTYIHSNKIKQLQLCWIKFLLDPVYTLFKKEVIIASAEMIQMRLEKSWTVVDDEDDSTGWSPYREHFNCWQDQDSQL